MSVVNFKKKIPWLRNKNEPQNDLEKEDNIASSSDDETEERDKWGNQVEFILACLGFGVGFGNIWRFPYLCMQNGGGAFLIPYFICMLLCAMPLFFLELTLGQFSSLSPISVWSFSPIFKGLGWAMVMLSGICSCYYNIILTWVIYYFGMSISSLGKSELPWRGCNNAWNTPMCTERQRQTLSNTSFFTNHNDTNETSIITAATYIYDIASNFTNMTESQAGKTPSEEFWQHYILELSPGMGYLNGIRWQTLICLIVSWFIIFLCMCKGVKSTGKVVYVTATLPYVFLFILLIRGATLPGAIDGVKYYIYPDFKKLLSFKVWAEACLQIFFSLGPTWGGLITMSSFNKFNNNILRDAILIPAITCCTSFFAGFVIFSVIGYMAHDAGVGIEDVITSGPGLAFIAYPDALSKMPLSQFWAITFFLMLLTVGLDTQFAMFDTIISGFVDLFPKQLSKRKPLLTACICVFQCVVGILFCSRAGMYWFQIVDWYCASFVCMIVGILECVACAYVYGGNRMYDDIEMMLGYRPSIWWKICWYAITPLFLVIIFGYTIGNISTPTYGDYQYPPWAVAFGWFVAMISIVPIPCFAIYEMIKAEGSFLQRLRAVTQPTEEWGPALKKYKLIYKQKFSPDTIATDDFVIDHTQEKVQLRTDAV